MRTLKWQNNSGDWFQDDYPVVTAMVIFKWKMTGGVTKRIEMWEDDELLDISCWICGNQNNKNATQFRLCGVLLSMQFLQLDSFLLSRLLTFILHRASRAGKK